MNAADVPVTTDLIALVARRRSIRTIAIRYSTLVCIAMLCAQATSHWLRFLLAS